MKRLYSLFAMVTCLFATMNTYAQPIVKQTNIAQSGVNLRTPQAVVLGMSILTAHPAGTAVVRFDGTCIADSGDRITLAASHTNDWSVNDGNVGVKVGSPTANRRGFSHTRVYTVAAGTDTFYAVGQNYVDQNGTGVASIYGHLTVEFFPVGTAAPVSENMNWNGVLSSGQRRMDSAVAASAPMGKVFVHMDGSVYSDPGDRIVLSANYMPSWIVGSGNVACMAISNSNRYSPFSHSRVFDITSNPNTFYAMGVNVVDQSGSGNATVTGNISAEFFPTIGGTSVDNTDIDRQGVNVRGSAVVLDSLVVTAPYSGHVLVQFDGYITSTVGDRMVLAASDTRTWGPNEACATVSAVSSANPFEVFSHSMLYPVTAGAHTYYAVAQNYVDQSGAGTLNISANFIAKFIPDAGVGVNDVAAAHSFTLYPNPAQNNMIILFPMLLDEMQTVEVIDMTGRALLTTTAQGVDQVRMDLTAIPAGIYLVRCNGVVKKLIKE